MKTEMFLAVGVALSTASCAIAQTDPDKPWFRWLIEPGDMYSTGNSQPPMQITPDASSVFYHAFVLVPGVEVRYGLHRARLPDGAMDLEIELNQSCFYTDYFLPHAASIGGTRVMGVYHEDWSVPYYFELNAADGLRTYEYDPDGWTPYWVSPSGESHLEFGSIDEEPWRRYRQIHSNGAVHEISPPPTAETYLPLYMSANDMSLGGRYHITENGERRWRPAVWVDGDFVGPPLDALRDDAEIRGISGDGTRAIGVVQDGEEDERQRRRTRIFTWGLDGDLTWLPIEYRAYYATGILASTDFRVVSFHLSEDVPYQSVPISRSYIWREGREIVELKNLLESEYGVELGDADVLLLSMSADGKTIAGSVQFRDSPAACGGQTQLHLFVAHIPDPIIGDLTRDWEVNGADLAAILAAWGSDDTNADLDGDGLVGSSDLAVLLAWWSVE